MTETVQEKELNLHETIDRLRRQQRQAAKNLSHEEIRDLVSMYYQVQEYRKSAGNQMGSLQRAKEPVVVVDWAYKCMNTIEDEIKKWMDIYTDSEPSGMGRWAKGVVGIGPIISAGLLAHISLKHWECTVAKSPKEQKCTPEEPHGATCRMIIHDTAGKIWSFAGLNPTAVWGEGQRRPWNASLKTLCWKIGQSFMKFHNHPDCVYGKIYAERKKQEIEYNEQGRFAEQAAITLQRLKNKNSEVYQTYASGKLAKGHIDARARRYAVKHFLCDWHYFAYHAEFGVYPPKPYPFTVLRHQHYREPGTLTVTTLDPETQTPL